MQRNGIETLYGPYSVILFFSWIPLKDVFPSLFSLTLPGGRMERLFVIGILVF